MLAIKSFGGTIAALCGRVSLQTAWGYLSAMPWSLGFGPLATEWTLMIVAMMTPLVSMQIACIGRCSRSNARAIGMAAFLLGYWLAWVATGLLLIPFVFALTSELGSGLAFAGILGLALIYSSSPTAQWARNRCHRSHSVPAIGLSIFTRNFRSALAIGTYCITACWPWMLLPFTVQSYHLLTMALVGIFLFFDRIAPIAQPIWRLAPGLKALLGFYSPFRKSRGLGIRTSTIGIFRRW